MGELPAVCVARRVVGFGQDDAVVLHGIVQMLLDIFPSLVFILGNVDHPDLSDVETGGVIAVFSQGLDIERRGVRPDCRHEMAAHFCNALNRLVGPRANPKRNMRLLDGLWRECQVFDLSEAALKRHIFFSP